MIQMLNNLIAIKKLGKQTSKQNSLDGLISMPEVADNQGIIRYIGPKVMGLEVGMKVYYGNKRHEIRMNGEDVLVMDEDNVYAIVKEETVSEESEKA